MSDRFQQMRAFVQVVDSGSFVAAAEALDSSKAAVSRQVAELEARLGVRLLHRTTRRLSLTADGERFHARCRTLLAELDAAEAELSAHHGKAMGVLRVSVPVSYGLCRLAPLWPRFAALHPQVQLEVTLSDLFADLAHEGLDLAIRISHQPGPHLIARRLGQARMRLCASPAYLARAGTPASPVELPHHRLLGHLVGAARDEWVFRRQEARAAPLTVRVAPAFRSNNGDTCVAMAVAGEGILYEPDFIVERALQAGTLVPLCADDTHHMLGIDAVYASRRHLAPKVRLLIDFLAMELGGEALPPMV